MRKTFSLLFLAWVLAIGLSSCQSKETRLYVATINDMHSNIDNFPMLAHVLDSLRAEHPDLLLFSAGDNRTGNPINDRCEMPARPIYELMNAVGFDLSCFGNHEWDAGVEALRDVMTVADFPFVCANVAFDDTLQMDHAPYVIIEVNGLKIGVIGAIQLGQNGLPDFHPNKAGGSHFLPAQEVIPDYLFLRDECNALFLLSHCGFEEDVDLAGRFPQFDAIFGGHSHTLVDSTRIFNGVMVTQAMSRVRYLTLSTFTFDEKGKMTDKYSQVIPIEESMEAKPDIKAMVDIYNNNGIFKQVMGYNDTEIVECRECLGNFMADAALFVSGADMAFQNHGGVRFDTLGVRPILLKDLLSLDPFNNELVGFMMTGEEIVKFLAVSFQTDHGPNFCAGCTYSYSVDDEGRMTDVEVTLANGKPLDMEAVYKVVTNSYVSAAFDFPHEDPGTDLFRTSNESLLAFIKEHPHIDYADCHRVFEK